MPRRLTLFIILLLVSFSVAAQQNWCRITGKANLIEGAEKVILEKRSVLM